MTSRLFASSRLLPALLLLAACSGGEPAQDVALAPSLEDATALGVANARMPVPGLVTAGQLSEAQLDGLVEAGYTNFISLRLASEDGAGWEEGHLASGDAHFTRLPVAGTEGLNRENVEALDRLLDAAAEEGTVLYCGSSNRVGALMALRAHWLDGATPEAALELGRAAGMTRLEPAVQMLGMSGG